MPTNILTPALAGLVLVLVGAALGLCGAIGFAIRPNRRSAIGTILSLAAAAIGWRLLQG